MRRSSEAIFRDGKTDHIGRPSANGVQALFANHLMLQGTETSVVVNDKEKGKHELFR